MGEVTPLSNQRAPFCFVLMPFRQELYYFFLYLQLYIETEFGITCERGDSHVSTKNIEKKIEDKICGADVIIADCTGNNANVFFELGIAHRAGREVILITQDNDLPANINNRDALRYNFHSHTDFIKELHRLLDGIIRPDPVHLLYARYKTLVIKEIKRSDRPWNILSKDEFKKLLAADYRNTQEPGGQRRELVLPEILDPQNSMPWDEIKRLIRGKTH